MKLVDGNHHSLTSISDDVDVNSSVDSIVDGMFELMVKNKGCGLAANQVGITKRIIVVSTDGFTGEIINPVISNGRFEKNSKEGCLSFKGNIITVKRFNRITVEGFDRNWKPIKKNLKALSAFCVQHEVDHLNGITILNKG